MFAIVRSYEKTSTHPVFIIIASCSKEIPSDRLVERNGIYYEVNSQTPFSGRVVSYYGNGQLKYKGNYKDGEKDGLWKHYESVN